MRLRFAILSRWFIIRSLIHISRECSAKQCALLFFFSPVRWFYIVLISVYVKRYIYICECVCMDVLLFCCLVPFLSFVSQWEKFKLICIWCLWPWSLLTTPHRTAQCTRCSKMYSISSWSNLCNVYGFAHNITPHKSNATQLHSK